MGLDEAGRGALAGPVVASAVVIRKPGRLRLRFLGGSAGAMRDSKKLSAKKREEFYQILTKHPWIEWGIGRASEKVIDRINILEATKLAMKRAIANLERKLARKASNRLFSEPGKGKSVSRINFLILDGKIKLDLAVSQRSVVKADEKIFSCMAASIIAKVTRDRLMRRYHQRYPQYDFAQHKGYATPRHQEMLKKYGRCDIHRKSFRINQWLSLNSAKQNPDKDREDSTFF